jgi:ATP-dependent Lon protease
VKSGLTIIPVATVDEVLSKALTGPLIPIEWKEDEHEATVVADEDEDEDAEAVWPHAARPGAGRPSPTPPSATPRLRLG